MGKQVIEKKYYRVSEIVKTGLPKSFVYRAVHSVYGNRFARKTGPKGIWLIDKAKFDRMIEQGYFEYDE